MDLTIRIYDENGINIDSINVYCDGSDSEQSSKIMDSIASQYPDAETIGVTPIDMEYPVFEMVS